MTDTNQLIELLREEALIKQGSGINNGCVDCSLMGTLADEAADALAAQQKRIEELEAALAPLVKEARACGRSLNAAWVPMFDTARAALAGKGGADA